MMSRFLKPKAIQTKSVVELLKLDVKKTASQLKDTEEIGIGLPTRQALDDVTNAGKQKQSYLGIRSFFTKTVAYMQKSFELRNPLLQALTCLHPAEKTKIA